MWYAHCFALLLFLFTFLSIIVLSFIYLYINICFSFRDSSHLSLITFNLLHFPFPSTFSFFIEKDCVWSQWSRWTDCNQGCDSSTQNRSRTIEKQPIYGGKPCEPNGNEEVRNCPNTCICQWSPWTPWTKCSQPCGGGTSNRTRTPLNSGCDNTEDCSANTASCNDFPCRNETSSIVNYVFSLSSIIVMYCSAYL